MVETATHRTNFVPNPLQKKFIESRATADLFSSRMGEGKSVGLAWSAFYHTKHNPRAHWGIARDTWENNQATTMKTFFEWFPPGIYGTFNHSKKLFTWAEGVAEGSVEFLGMDDPQDASKLMSREFGGLAFDEPAPAVGSTGIDEMIFDIGLSRLRQPGMSWYGMKLAENNPDEAHWTYRRFVNPGTDGFKVWQPERPENEKNLPPSYYAELRRLWAHRPDLIRRFVEGDFGFQSIGKSVTPQWNDKIHIGIGLIAVREKDLHLLWDWGLNPTCIVTQVAPSGHWNILHSFVGDGIGVEELIQDQVKPLLAARFPKFSLRHIGDPAGMQREQSSSSRSAVRSMLRELGGHWRSGPVKTWERLDPLQSVLARTINGRGVVQVDRDNATHVWQALRGGWHFHVARTGLISAEPQKNIHSHPGDAMGYGAAVLFPMGRLKGAQAQIATPAEPGNYFGSPRGELLQSPQAGTTLPSHGSRL